ncbi:DUF4097 family beta strand repeat-containing protein [Roseburia hominis]
MKKGWKIFWIVIAVISVMGITFCGIALCMGVSFQDLNYRYSGSRLARLLERWHDDDIDDLDDILENDWDNIYDEEWFDDDWTDSGHHHHGSGKTSTLSECDFKDITELKLSLGRCKVNVRTTDQNCIHIDTSKLYYPEYNMELSVKHEGNTLSIVTLKEGEVWDVITAIKNHETNGLAGTLDIYIPQNLHLTRAELELGGCDANFTGLTADEVTIQSGATDCDLENVIFGTLNAEVGAGDLDLSGTISGDITARCGAGDMDLKLTGKETDYNYSLKCGAGEIEINGHEYGGLASAKKIDHGSSKTIDIACGAGDVTIEFTHH